MSVVFEGGAVVTSTGGGNSTRYFNYTVGSGANRVLYIWESRNHMVGASYNGVAMQHVGQFDRFQLYRLIDPASGTNTMAVTASGSYNPQIPLGIADFSGVEQTTPNETPQSLYLDIPYSNVGSFISTPSVVVPAGNMALGVGTPNGSSSTGVSNGTAIGFINDLAIGYRTGGGAISFTGGAGSRSWSAILVINAVSSAASFSPDYRRRNFASHLAQ